MPPLTNKATAAWRERVLQTWQNNPNQNQHSFCNFVGDVLTRNQLIRLLTSDATAWNNFKRKQKHSIIWYETGSDRHWVSGYVIDLRRVDLRKADLTGRDLSNINFTGSNLSGADFSRSTFDLSDINGRIAGHTSLTDCNLRRTKWAPAHLRYVRANNADFSRAELNGVTLNNCRLQNAKFAKALIAAEFDSSDVSGTDFGSSLIFTSSFFNMDLSAARNLNLASYHPECRIDYQTIKLSERVPAPLLAACGVADFHIPYIDAISKNSAKHPSCFISYSVKDGNFVQYFRNQLTNKGIRNWFAPRDLPFGSSTRDVIESQIRSHDRLIVVLSKSSIQSQWVQFEVETALEIERKKRRDILIPVCIDDTVFKTRVSWARHIARTKNIAIFKSWRRGSNIMDDFVRRISKREQARR